MSNITINVDFLAGTSIEHAIGEAKIKASLWHVAYVKFDFNGVKISIKQNTDVEETVERYHTTMKSDTKHKFVVG